jgi:hypothetical protein
MRQVRRLFNPLRIRRAGGDTFTYPAGHPDLDSEKELREVLEAQACDGTATAHTLDGRVEHQKLAITALRDSSNASETDRRSGPKLRRRKPGRQR